MSMTKAELSRLEKIERFVQKLTLGSYLAKAASENGRIIGDRRLLENGEQILAKAASAYDSAETLLAVGDREIDDATTMGIFAGHVAARDFDAARDVLLDVKERGRVAKAVDAAQQVDTVLGDDDLAGYDTRASISELTSRFGALERTLAAVETRLAQLETRPQTPAPAPVPAGPTVAKAGAKRRLTAEQDAQALMDDLERYVDDASTVGALSSMIQNGDLEKVRPMVERARQAHETEKVKSERRGFRR